MYVKLRGMFCGGVQLRAESRRVAPRRSWCGLPPLRSLVTLWCRLVPRSVPLSCVSWVIRGTVLVLVRRWWLAAASTHLSPCAAVLSPVGNPSTPHPTPSSSWSLAGVGRLMELLRRKCRPCRKNSAISAISALAYHFKSSPRYQFHASARSQMCGGAFLLSWMDVAQGGCANGRIMV